MLNSTERLSYQRARYATTDSAKIGGILLIGLLVEFAGWPSFLQAEILVLKNGMTVQGVLGKIATVGDGVLSPLGDTSSTEVKLIYAVDDGLRRTFVSKYQIDNFRPDVEFLQHIKLRQRPGPTTSGRSVGTLAPAPWPPSPFDEWGRRTYPLLTPRGRLDVIQGVTRITPVYTSLQALQAENAIQWDMRVGTSSIPRDVLQRILQKHLNMEEVDDRLTLVRLFLQSLRYTDAEAELREVLAKFPDRPELGEQLRDIQRLAARQKVDEIKLRQAAGQHRLVHDLLRQLLAADIPAEIAGEVQEMADAYGAQEAQAKRVLDFLKTYFAELSEGPPKVQAQAFLQEVEQSISSNSLPRFADFLRLSSVEGITKDAQYALALSGWLTEGQGIDNPTVASSLIRVRELVVKFLLSPSASEREAILSEMQSQAGAQPELVAKILAALDPPAPPPVVPPPGPASTDPKNPAENPVATPVPEGYFALDCPGLKAGETFKYRVQLPPEYDPHRRYPVIVTLHGSSSTAEMQLEWWTGAYDPNLKMRLGQATRHGYIVIAPEWLPTGAKQYDYSAASHAKILYVLRDALNRFALDSDRIFLTGYLEGGEAAWDMALAHPDVWAGVIPVEAIAYRGQPESPKYLLHLWENAKYVPLYFLHGDKDGLKVSKNASEFDRYLTKPGFDTVVVEYEGRGEEHFPDDIHRLFDWMNHHTRATYPLEFDVSSRRPWDNFFWFVELENLPAQAMIAPEAWPAKNAARPTPVKASVKELKRVLVNSKAQSIRVYLGPEFVDFASDVSIIINGQTPIRNCRPDIKVMLEDARTRRDRKHPFWALHESIRKTTARN